MAIRDKIAANSARFLEPGEQIQSVFVAQTASQFLILIGLLPFILVNKYRCVVATDRRLLVLDAGKLTTTKPKSVIRALPRSTRIGPFSGALWYVSGNLERRCGSTSASRRTWKPPTPPHPEPAPCRLRPRPPPPPPA